MTTKVSIIGTLNCPDGKSMIKEETSSIESTSTTPPGLSITGGAPTEQSMPSLTPLTPSPSKGNVQSCSDIIEEENEEKLLEACLEKKEKAILSCLNGELTSKQNQPDRNEEIDGETVEDQLIDLWHLRHLALTRGGLLCSAIRKRVWPKLVGVNDSVLAMTTRQHVSEKGSDEDKILLDEEIKMIKKDINSCVWNVEHQMKKTREGRIEFKKLAMLHRDDDSSVTSFDSGCSSTASGKLTPRFMPESIRVFSKMKTGPTMDCQKHGVLDSPMLHVPLESVSEVIYEDEHSLSNSVRTNKERTYNGKTKRRAEKRLVLNVLTTVLRKKPLFSSNENDDWFNFFKGMSNIAAIVLINTESPSITSLILTALSQNHFRDALLLESQTQKAAIKIVFNFLMSHFDPILLNKLIKGGVSDPGDFCLRWITQWFAQDIQHYEVVSRLFDVFLVSHPMLPVYVSVAILTYPPNRKRILMTPCERSQLIGFLPYLPSSTVADCSETQAINTVEQIIELSLSYIKTVPPCHILNTFHKTMDEKLVDNAFSSYMLKHPPAWSQVDTAFTDWTLIQRRKLSDDIMSSHSMKREGNTWEFSKTVAEDYELALFASGLAFPKKSSQLKRLSCCLIFFALLIPCLSLWRSSLLEDLAKESSTSPIFSHRVWVSLARTISVDCVSGNNDFEVSDSKGSNLENSSVSELSQKVQQSSGAEQSTAISVEDLSNNRIPGDSSVDSFNFFIERENVCNNNKTESCHFEVMDDDYEKEPLASDSSFDFKSERDSPLITLTEETMKNDPMMKEKFVFSSIFRFLAEEVEKSPDQVNEWYF